MVIGTPVVLNLIPGGVNKVVHVNQVNDNIEIQFQIMNGSQPYNVTEGVSCTIRGTKGDSYGYTAEAATAVGSNVVTVTLTEQLTAVAGGCNVFELVFVGAENSMKVSTENFILAVERAALGEDTVISDSDLAYAAQVLDQLQSVGAVNAQVQQNKANIAAEITRATAAEQTLQSNINAEASSRATTDASLQSQINQLIAPSGSAPSAAEVENARVGADGTTYPTLGDAIRTQVTDVKTAFIDVSNLQNECIWGKYTVPSAKRIDVLFDDLPFAIGNGSSIIVDLKISGTGKINIYDIKQDGTTQISYANIADDINYEKVRESAYKGMRFYVFDANNATVSLRFSSYNALSIVNNYAETISYTTLNAKSRYKFIVGSMTPTGMPFLAKHRLCTIGWCYTPDDLTIVGNGKVKVSLITADDIKGTNPIDHSWVTTAYGTTSYIITAGSYFKLQIADINGVEDVSNVITDIASSRIYTGLDLISASEESSFKNSVIGVVQSHGITGLNGVTSVAHQGYIKGQFTGHSTLKSVVGAYKAGFTDIETDVRFSSDGVPVLCHDDRFTDSITGTVVIIADHTAAELQTYHYYGDTIATLDEFLNLSKCLGMTVWLDQVANADTDAKWSAVFDVVTKYQMQDHVVWISMTEAIINKITAYYSKSKFNFTASNDFWKDYAISQATLHSASEIILTLNYTEFSVNEVQSIQTEIPQNTKLGMYTIDDVATYESYMPFVSAMVSNAISLSMIIDSITAEYE